VLIKPFEKRENHINKTILTNLTMLETTKVSSKGQIVIPERMRKHLGLKEGTKLVLIEKDRKIMIQKEGEFMKIIEEKEISKEKMGWLMLTEKNLAKTWDNPIDDEVWNNY